MAQVRSTPPPNFLQKNREYNVIFDALSNYVWDFKCKLEETTFALHLYFL